MSRTIEVYDERGRVVHEEEVPDWVAVECARGYLQANGFGPRRTAMMSDAELLAAAHVRLAEAEIERRDR